MLLLNVLSPIDDGERPVCTRGTSVLLLGRHNLGDAL